MLFAMCSLGQPNALLNSNLIQRPRSCQIHQYGSDPTPYRGGKMNRRIAIRRLATFFLTTASLAHAQQAKKVYRIGYLTASDPARDSTRAEAIRPALRERGYIEGQNIAIEYRYAEGIPIGSLSLRPSWCVSTLISSW